MRELFVEARAALNDRLMNLTKKMMRWGLNLGEKLMRAILICSLAATLAGCSCLAPRQAIMSACSDPERYNCSDNGATATRIQAKSTTTKISSVARTNAVT